MSTVGAVVRWRARRHPDLPATWFEGRTRTFAQLEASSTELAAGLVERLAIRPGDRVAVLDKNSDTYLELFVACDKAGAVIVPLNWRLTAREVADVAGDADPAVLVVGEGFAEAASQVTCRTIGFDELPRVARPDPRRDQEHAPTWQLYTSGTTGLPKGTVLTNDNLFGLTTPIRFECPELQEGARSLVAMPFYHIGGSGWAFASLSSGSCAVVVREVVPPSLCEVIVQQQVATGFVVPAVLLFLSQLPEAESADFSGLRNLVYGASPISPDLLRRSIDVFGCRFTQVYGLTETTGAITALQFEHHEGEHLLSCGRPMFSSRMKVVDPDDHETAAGEIGEIVYRGPGLMQGYWNRPDDTAAAIRDGWFHTGDAGVVDADGFFYVKDRVKDMIISGGENIYPAELEGVLAGHPDVADVAVIGIPDPTWGEAVKAIVVRRPSSTLIDADLIEWSRGRLAGFKRPRSVDFVETIPRNPSGKILKRELRERYWSAEERQVH
jgi:long-chain acyl-CoA synthetase